MCIRCHKKSSLNNERANICRNKKVTEIFGEVIIHKKFRRIMKFESILLLFTGLCHGVSKAAECTSRGRFPNNDAEDCRGYTMCIMGGPQTFTSYKLTCPVGTVYSHLEMLCTNASTYKCLPSHVCTEAGNFESPNSNCTSYIACVRGVNGFVTARQIDCPQDQVFNNVENMCVNSTEFNCNVIDNVPESLGHNTTVVGDTKDIGVGRNMTVSVTTPNVNETIEFSTEFSVSNGVSHVDVEFVTFAILASYVWFELNHI